MYYQQNQTEEAIRILYQKDQEVSQFMDQLVYGKVTKYFNINSEKQEIINLHLHPTCPDLLLATSVGNSSFVFNLENLHINRVDLEDQKKYNLNVKKSIQLEEDGDQIYLLMKDEKEKEDFTMKLHKLAKFLKGIPKGFDSMMMKYFTKADKNNNMSIDREQLQALFKEIHLGDENEINEIMEYKFVNSKVYEEINLREFEKKTKFMSCRKEFIDIFKRYVPSFYLINRNSLFTEVMTKNQFSNFLREDQKENSHTIQKLCDKLYKSYDGDRKSRISFFQFCSFLMSPSNSVGDPAYLKDSDLRSHFNQYYCFSSHNTYLTGNQLYSDSNAQRYYEDLCHGIRCVQIDCHDGNDEPIVKHGYTATSSIKFSQVIKQISKFSNLYEKHTPIIISLQNHCNNQNQIKIANCLTDHFKDSLIKIEEFKNYPILGQLLGKIVIRGTGSFKIYQDVLSTSNINQQEMDIVEIEETIELFENQDFMEEQKMKLSKIKKNKDKEKDRDREEGMMKSKAKGKFQKNYKELRKLFKNFNKEKDRFDQKKKVFQDYVRKNFQSINKKKKVKILNSVLLKITSMLNSGNMTLEDGSPWQSISMSQNQIQDVYYSYKRHQILQFAQKSWVRVYPKGTRFDSSNYDPLISMQLGAQIIAMNTQRADEYSHIMNEFFQKGSQLTTGYRLKPKILPQKEVELKISITPISASRIYFNDQKRKYQIPEVEVMMRYFGTPKDVEKNSHLCSWQDYTEKIPNNAYNPIFKSARTMTLRLKSKQFGFIIFEIKDCGMAVIQIDNIRLGYRTVTLKDKQYETKQSRLICLFE